MFICKWLHAVFIYCLSNDIKQSKAAGPHTGGGVDQRACCLCLITDSNIDGQNRCSLILYHLAHWLAHCFSTTKIRWATQHSQKCHHRVARWHFFMSGPVFYWTLLLFLSPNILSCQILLCFYFHLTPSISLSLPVRHSFSQIGPVKARILTAQSKNTRETLGAMGGKQKACQCPGRVLDFGTHLSLSSTLPGTDGSGQWQPVTDD